MIFLTPRRPRLVGGTSGVHPELVERFYLEPVEGADAPKSKFLSFSGLESNGFYGKLPSW
jgi:hypothetical protein